MDSPTRFSSEQPEELQEYRALSTLAIVSAICAGISCAAVFIPLFWVLAPLTALLALICLFRIRRSNSEMTGEKLALFSLALSVLVMAWIPTQELIRSRYLYSQAREFGTQWLTMVKNRETGVAAAYALETLTGPPLSQQEHDHAPVNEGSVFTEDPLKSVLENGQELRFVGYRGMISMPSVHHIKIEYEVALRGEPSVVSVTLTLERLYHPQNGKYYWQVIAVA